ncbi:DinB family protein [Arthrobacter sp. H5]|uniref:DinB family protein n=1 Tax=Arthrobacter sp. H5 TaxID=1267973 RepID=UPI0004B35D4D|nr:DinB family protein [Arthrobacter sp. H5]
MLAGAVEWGRDGGRPHPWPPPVTTIAWRLNHLTGQLSMRADYTTGSRSLQSDEVQAFGTAAEAVAAFDQAAEAWHGTLAGADNAALDTAGYSTYPDGSDPEDVFIDTVWWVNQELLHHGAEIALLRDLYRART